ncbi:MAG: hypothetical protein AAF903_14050 [Pseudomonadota bacterium]
MLAFLQAIKWIMEWLQRRAAETAARDLARRTKQASRTRQKQADRTRQDVVDDLRRFPERLHDDDGFRRP